MEDYSAIKRKEILIQASTMDESWKYYAKGKQSVKKNHVLNESINMKCPQ